MREMSQATTASELAAPAKASSRRVLRMRKALRREPLQKQMKLDFMPMFHTGGCVNGTLIPVTSAKGDAR